MHKAQDETLPRLSDNCVSTSGRLYPQRSDARSHSRSHQRSQMGPQVLSEKRSAPSIGFGSSSRFDFKNTVFLSKAHSNAITPVWTPGPGAYGLAAAVGAQPMSEKRSAASCGFGTDARFADLMRTIHAAQKMPAPGDYKPPQAFGEQMQSGKSTSGSVAFATAKRENNICYKGFEEAFYARDSPGPGTYKAYSGLGKQLANGKYSQNGPRFGKDAKPSDPNKKNDIERTAAGIPGPGEYPLASTIGVGKPRAPFGTSTRGDDVGSLAALKKDMMAAQHVPMYKQYGSIGKQPESYRRNQPSFGFGSSSRFTKSVTESPGPGTYVV